jgi:hypothetical protein
MQVFTPCLCGGLWVPGWCSRSVPAGEALGSDVEFVALRVLHDRPALARNLVFADDRGAETNQFVNG